MTEQSDASVEALFVPPPRLFERLSQLTGYEWDTNIAPVHSSFDNWHCFGTKTVEREVGAYNHDSSSSSPLINQNGPLRPSLKHYDTTKSHNSSNADGRRSVEMEFTTIEIVARISPNALRLEREFNLCKALVQQADPNCAHTVRPLDFVRLSAQPGEEAQLVVSIFASPGKNWLPAYIDFGPAFTGPRLFQSVQESAANGFVSATQMDVPTFLEFAIGACECLELLHHGLQVLHGEIRGDAFHFEQESGSVRLLNCGVGSKSFENGLTSAWERLSREIGVATKLRFLAPEQTGRLAVEPDSRTDIYSLGVLFYTLLTGSPAVEGSTPMEIIQSVLAGRIRPIDTKRKDVPVAVSQVVGKMVKRQMDQRYYSCTGIKHDLEEIQNLLTDGDRDGLNNFKVGVHDVSSLFELPSMILGRTEEQAKIIRIIEKVSRRQKAIRSNTRVLSNISSGHAAGRSDRSDSVESNEGGSLSSSQRDDDSRRSSSIVTSSHPPHTQRDSVSLSIENGVFSDSTKSITHGANGIKTMIPRRFLSLKHYKNTKTEVVVIFAGPGLGKSSLVQNIRPSIRRHGYTATAKFDSSRKRPLEAFLKVFASFLKQIFSESNLHTPYHTRIRSALRPSWETLSSKLDLPSSLLDDGERERAEAVLHSLSRHSSDHTDNVTVQSRYKSNLMNKYGAPSFSGCTQSIRLISTFLEVLRVLAIGKLLVVCLDDIQHADEESTEMIHALITSRLPIVLILTSRTEADLTRRTISVLDSDDTCVTRIKLKPLTEAEVLTYVSATLLRDKDYVFPLAAVALDKTRGNPFYIKQFLQVCHQKNCIWFSYKTSQWEFDLNRVFSEFESDEYDQQLNTAYITRIFRDQLPEAARIIMAWATLLGTTFSFSIVRRLMSGEFMFEEDDYGQDVTPCTDKPDVYQRQSKASAIDGLQACISANVLVQTEVEDIFRFSHDRYLRAARSLRECYSVEKMHFVIALTLMKYTKNDDQSLYDRARHIGECIDVIKRRIENRAPFRDTLSEAAGKATSSGARATALEYYQNAIQLLQSDPWDEKLDDVDYDETLELYLQAAESNWFLGRLTEALRLLSITFAHARSVVDKAPCWILQSRIFAEKGDFAASFDALKASLNELGLEFEQETTWEQCDKEFLALRDRINSVDTDVLVERPLVEDSAIMSMGSVLIESLGTAYWSEPLMFYQMGIKMMEVHMSKGAYLQIPFGCNHLSIIAMSRFFDMDFGKKMVEVSSRLLEKYNDSYITGRFLSVSTIYGGHFLTALHSHLSTLEDAVDYCLVAGDKIGLLIAVGGLALTRLYIGHDLVEVEAFCVYAPEDYGDWKNDYRGGAILTAVRQVARALRGSTMTSSAHTIMSDGEHNSEEYLKSIGTGLNAQRPIDIYKSLSMIPLFTYGHYSEAVAVGQQLLLTSDLLWGMRNRTITLFYLSLSMLAQLREDSANIDGAEVLATVQEYKVSIESWGSACIANFAMYSMLIEAESSEIIGDFENAAKAYESAIDHCQVYQFPFEEALGLELQAEFLVRRGIKRAARAVLHDAIAAYARINATGKVEFLTVKHEWLLQTATTARTNDVGVQTSSSIMNTINPFLDLVPHRDVQLPRSIAEVHTGDDLLSPKDAGSTFDFTALGLDVLDFQNILRFNQAISSELEIDVLLGKMTEIILESSAASFGGVVLDNDNDGWAFATSGTAEGLNTVPVKIHDFKDETTKQVVLYTLRFREIVFVDDIFHDERFGNHANTSKAVMSLPILHGDRMFGLLYLEGPVHAFTNRNLWTMQTFISQAAISIANANLFREVQRVSASNASMIESQKRALKTARMAEEKARLAEAEAIRNMKLKEEAARAKSMFLANVSHELRTPLNGVIGMSELLKSTDLTQQQEEYADSVRVCADTLLTVINDILDFSKLEAGKMQLFSVPLNLNQTIREVVRALTYTNLERGLETIVDLDLDPHQLVLGDPVRIHQIFLNLLSNAYKFTSEGSVTIRARREREDDKSVTVTCSVQDTGIGITQEQLAKLFKPFAQADETTQRSYGGSGLGLSICKALIAVLKGRIWLESQIGEGTTVSFTVTFPKTNGVSEDEKQISVRRTDPMATWSSDADGLASRPPSRQSNHLALLPRDQIRICIAEDNPINQKIAISFVRKLGFQCQAYSDGMQAVTGLREASAKGDPFSLVLMDCQMPVLDGYDATRLIRKDKDPAVRDVLIIAMTASAIRGDREKCIEAGMNNYMAKPVRAQVLKEMLEEYMSPGQKQIPSVQEHTKNIEQKALEDDNKETGATTRKENRKEVTPLDLHGDANGVLSPPYRRSDTPVTARLDERPKIKKRGSSANTTILITDHKEQELKTLEERSNNGAQ